MIGGVSIITFFAVFIIYGFESVPPWIYQLAALLAVFVNYPHFSATVYRLYQDSNNIRQFPITAIILPIILAGAIAASFWQPEVVAPYLVMLYLIWSPYHYSGQTLGITLVYARRSNFLVGQRERFALSMWIFGSFAHSVARRQVSQTRTIYDISVPSMAFPAWVDVVASLVMWVGVAALLLLVAAWCRTNRRMLPPIVLLPAAAQTLWFLPGYQFPIFFVFVPLFHSLQYLYLAWVMQLGLRLGHDPGRSSWSAIRAESLKWFIRNYVGGIALFILLPLIFFWTSLPFAIVTGILIAAVNIHHFFVDGVIWKLRDSRVASPLMLSISDLATES
jgi:hypothetical protein